MKQNMTPAASATQFLLIWNQTQKFKKKDADATINKKLFYIYAATQEKNLIL